MNQDQDRIVFEKVDDWLRFSSYNDTRILDALACLFHVISPCAAAVLYNNVLYISYNSHLESSLYRKVQFKLSLIEQVLKNSKLQELLGLYLIWNHDHIEFIKNQRNYEKDEQHKSALHSFITTCHEIKFEMDKDINALKNLSNINKENYSELYNTINKQYYEIITEYAQTLTDREIINGVEVENLYDLKSELKILKSEKNKERSIL